MSDDVNAYCESCGLCAVNKSRNHKPYGLLHTLEVPTEPWQVIGVDFVGPLPESETLNGKHDMIMMIICHLTSMVHLVATKQTYRARDIAEVMFDRVYKLHGMPRAIVSDRDTLFTSTFWDKLNELTGIQLRMSTSFHPQSDGASERANRTMNQMLRMCVSEDQKDWASKLPNIEFAMNSARSETTGFAPFVLNNGRMPRPMIWNSKCEYPGVRVFAQKMKDAILRAHDAILETRIKQTRTANRHRKDSPFIKGDLVYLSTENLSLPKGRARKLAPKYVGPYKILDDLRNNAYLIDLPADLKRRGLNPTFHASKLRVHIPNDDRRFPGRRVEQLTAGENSTEWVVSRIITHHGKGRNALFQIEWKSGDRTWMPISEIEHLEALTAYLEASGVASVEQLPRGRGQVPDEILVSAIRAYPRSEPVIEGIKATGLGAEEPNHYLASSAAMFNNYSLEQVTTFKDYSAYLATTPSPSNPVPPGYLEYCVAHQHDQVNRLILPPNTPVDYIERDGVSSFVLSPPRIAVADTDWPRGRGGRRNVGRGRQRSASAGQKSQISQLQRALINTLNADSELSRLLPIGHGVSPDTLLVAESAQAFATRRDAMNHTRSTRGVFIGRGRGRGRGAPRARGGHRIWVNQGHGSSPINETQGHPTDVPMAGPSNEQAPAADSGIGNSQSGTTLVVVLTLANVALLLFLLSKLD